MPTKTPLALIQAQNLTIGYAHSAPVAQKLHFKIYQGDFLCIVGPNGSGKSTLIKTLLGLLKPLSGKLTFAEKLQNHLGYLPQDSQIDPHFPASVREIVLSGCLNQLGPSPFFNKTHRDRADYALRALRLSALSHQNFGDLSGGQRQKVLLARALCATSSVLVLDEPSNNLDFASKQSFYQNLLTLNQTKKLAIIMVTHDLDHHNLLGDHILALATPRPNHYFFGSTKQYVELVHHA